MPNRPPIHSTGHAQQVEKARGSSSARGYDGRWQRYRTIYLRQHPQCVHCLAENRSVPATVVDHKRPHKGNMGLFWDTENHQPLCKRHHDIKTATEDGGFGR